MGSVGGVIDPLLLAGAITRLQGVAERLGLHLSVNFDFEELARVRAEVRPDVPDVYAYFHTDLNSFAPENAFWISAAVKETGRVIFLLAYRLDHVDRPFSDWAQNLNLSIRGRMGAGMILERPVPRVEPLESVRGPVAYQGEYFIARNAPRKVSAALTTLLPRFGLVLAYTHFRKPEMVWSLTEERIAVRGGMARAHHTHSAPNFFRWKEGALPPDTWFQSEWVSYSMRDDIEWLIREIAETPDFEQSVLLYKSKQ